ncbi:hypothetical protein M9Y10_025103 [Tritrichomonas musculus]|uniref:DUF3447 domain-containing protein n=1 Tax=Tritrichomonas musculus TaxID=1915356 RepID=A0ABR2GM57_9EUKA
MNSQEYLDAMKDIQENILNFLEGGDRADENFIILESKFYDINIKDYLYELLSLLHLIAKIGNNHHRSHDFFSKIEKILLIFEEDIKKYIPNSEIFNIFKRNKKILLFLIEQQIIVFNEYIIRKITTTKKYIKDKYPQYFQPEIQPFINEKWFPKKNGWVKEIKKELPNNFHKKRKEGENDSQICELIRNDMIAEFLAFITRNNVSLNAKIQPSIYETNLFLLKKDGGFSLIEYAVFFGSIQIFNYLRLEGVELTSSLWPFAIHGQNAEIIHFLEDNNVELDDNSCKQIFYESIKCHHNDIANYFINNFLQSYVEDSQDTFNRCLKYYNFHFLKKEFISESQLCNLCKFDHYALVDILLKDNEIDVNKKGIFDILLIKFQLKDYSIM